MANKAMKRTKKSETKLVLEPLTVMYLKSTGLDLKTKKGQKELNSILRILMFTIHPKRPTP